MRPCIAAGVTVRLREKLARLLGLNKFEREELAPVFATFAALDWPWIGMSAKMRAWYYPPFPVEVCLVPTLECVVLTGHDDLQGNSTAKCTEPGQTNTSLFSHSPTVRITVPFLKLESASIVRLDLIFYYHGRAVLMLRAFTNFYEHLRSSAGGAGVHGPPSF
jgi:hypothetical protein